MGADSHGGPGFYLRAAEVNPAALRRKSAVPPAAGPLGKPGVGENQLRRASSSALRSS